MSRFSRSIRFILIGCLAVVAPASSLRAEPAYVYLTWQGDTSTTITVNFQTIGFRGESFVAFDTEARGGASALYARQAKGESSQIPGLSDRWIHRVELKGLLPGTTYHFVAGDPATGLSVERKFRTIPDQGSPLRFITGGDTGGSEANTGVTQAAVAREPYFLAIGGDFAYADGRLENVALWDSWLRHATDEYVTPSGYTVPLVLAIGNHEVNKFRRQEAPRATPSYHAPFFLGFFAQHGETTYFRRQFGPDVVLYVLDSGHIQPHGGAQAAWLEEQLRADAAAGISHRFALYHVPFYPSYRPFEEELSAAGRRHWLPLFEQHGVSAGFENHDHTYKRSKLLWRGQVAEAGRGILYLGDGNWGRSARSLPLEPRWYIARQGTFNHAWQVDVRDGRVEYRAFDEKGNVFDVFPEDAEGAQAARAYFAGLPQDYIFPRESLRLVPPLAESGPFSRGKLSGLFTNLQPYPAEVELWVEAPEPLLIEPAREQFTLEPGDARPLEFSFKADQVPLDKLPRASLRYRIEYRLPDRTASLTGAKEVRVQPLRRAAGRVEPVRIDGTLQEWGELPFHVEAAADPADAEKLRKDYSARFAVERDEDFLYLAFEVRDDVVLQDPASSPYRQEGLSVILDVLPSTKRGMRPSFAFRPDPGEGTLIIPVIDDMLPPDQQNDYPQDLRYATKTAPGGYTAEFAIPRAYFEQYAEGAVEYIRLNVLLADKDKPEERHRELWWQPRWYLDGDEAGSGAFWVGW